MKYIHAPWEAGPLSSATYPPPIVDHREARERALAVYAPVLGSHLPGQRRRDAATIARLIASLANRTAPPVERAARPNASRYSIARTMPRASRSRIA